MKQRLDKTGSHKHQTFLDRVWDKTAARAALMAAAGCLTIFLPILYFPSQPDGNGGSAAAASPSEPDGSRTDGEGVLKRLFNQPSLVLKNLLLRTDRTSYRPCVLNFNLTALIPEQGIPAAADDISVQNVKQRLEELYSMAASRLPLPYGKSAAGSHGGILYEELNRRDAAWMSTLYSWIKDTPEQAAARLGLPSASVEGSYDPSNPEQNREDPSTWVIPDWKNIRIQVCDGDGRPVSLASNAKAIASMASVYTYYTGWDDISAFQAYADRLWENSHSCTVSISDVYGCDGCTENAVPASEGTLASSERTPAAIPEKALGPASDASGGGLTGKGGGSGPSAAVGPAHPATGADALPAADGGEEMTADMTAGADEAGAGESGAGESGAGESGAGESEAGGSEPASSESIYDREAVDKTFCPGHVDLIITIKIIGLTEKNNLFTLQAAEGQGNSRGWPGWTGYTEAYAKQLYAQDWQKEYGLSPAILTFGTPLTAEQMTSYMKLLPADTSDGRKSLIAFALNSVGKIPYYYGGKARASGYENNQFYAPAPPDKRGRILSGLDCSGWINWVYWSVNGVKPAAYGTNGLAQAGQAVGRERLQPGDIIVKPGEDSHVMMFLGWTEDGSMICVHETGGSTNNVTVSVVNVDWPYYRSLLD